MLIVVQSRFLEFGNTGLRGMDLEFVETISRTSVVASEMKAACECQFPVEQGLAAALVRVPVDDRDVVDPLEV